MLNYSNLREVADRLRMATSSLAKPYDLAIVKQYIFELESLAHGQDLVGAQTAMAGDTAPCRPSSLPNNGSAAEGSGHIRPLKRLRPYGQLKKISKTGENPRKWVLRSDDILHSKSASALQCGLHEQLPL